MLGKLERIEKRNNRRATIARNSSKEEADRRQAPEEQKAPKTIAVRDSSRSSKKCRHTPVVLEQWVEIETEASGVVRTALFPANEVLLRHAQEMEPAPELVYRRLHFVNGVPAAYSWATADLALRTSGGLGIQRMKMETWLQLIELEKTLPDGHLLPTTNLPRPQERGGCACEVCVKNEGF